jgi:Family of unknown function (DUF6428)
MILDLSSSSDAKEKTMTATLNAVPTLNSTTKDFLASLTDHGAKALVFDLDGRQIQPGYHVTELKAATFETMDCGGQGNLWHETIVQLMPSPAEQDRGYMSVEKFMGIYNRVSGSVPVRPQAEIRFEYGDDGQPAIQYHVRGIDLETKRLVVRLESTRVTCKANDRRDAMTEFTMLETNGSACCGPSSAASGAETSSATSKCC